LLFKKLECTQYNPAAKFQSFPKVSEQPQAYNPPKPAIASNAHGMCQTADFGDIGIVIYP
jgi:hypothetical protein